MQMPNLPSSGGFCYWFLGRYESVVDYSTSTSYSIMKQIYLLRTIILETWDVRQKTVTIRVDFTKVNVNVPHMLNVFVPLNHSYCLVSSADT
jgi:hypothetical protein